MHVAKAEVDVRMQIPGAVIRQRTEFGSVKGFDRLSGECFTLAAGVDTTPLFEGLEGNLCQCPHWGFVLRGRSPPPMRSASGRRCAPTTSSTGRPGTT